MPSRLKSHHAIFSESVVETSGASAGASGEACKLESICETMAIGASLVAIERTRAPDAFST